jgi:hypothetical protein
MSMVSLEVGELEEAEASGAEGARAGAPEEA